MVQSSLLLFDNSRLIDVLVQANHEYSDGLRILLVILIVLSQCQKMVKSHNLSFLSAESRATISLHSDVWVLNFLLRWDSGLFPLDPESVLLWSLELVILT